MVVYLVWSHDYDEVMLEGIYANVTKAEEVVKDFNDEDLNRHRVPYAVIEPWEVEE